MLVILMLNIDDVSKRWRHQQVNWSGSASATAQEFFVFHHDFRFSFHLWCSTGEEREKGQNREGRAPASCIDDVSKWWRHQEANRSGSASATAQGFFDELRHFMQLTEWGKENIRLFWCMKHEERRALWQSGEQHLNLGWLYLPNTFSCGILITVVITTWVNSGKICDS